MKMTMSAYFAKIIFFVFLIQAIGTDSFHLGEVVKTTRTEDAYVGWPHTIKCKYNWRSTLCKIDVKATGENVYDQETAPLNEHSRRPTRFYLGDITDDTPTEYVITYKDATSGKIENIEEYTLNIIEFPQQTVQQAMEDERLDTTLEAAIGDAIVLDCEARHELEIDMHVSPPKETCNWYYNGVKITSFVGRNREGSCEFAFPSVRIEQYGVYSCAYTHNGLSRFMLNYHLNYEHGMEKLTRTEGAYFGWPHVIECSRASRHIRWSTLCKIYVKATGENLYEQPIARSTRSIYIGDVTTDSPKQFIITYENKTTGEVETIEEYNLNVTNLPQQTAQQAMADKILNTKFDSYIGSRKIMDCGARHELEVGIFVPRDNQTCSWYYNGTKMTTFDGKNIEGSCQIDFPNVRLEQYGVYTCAYNYNGQSRFTINHNLCYKPSRIINFDKTMDCPTEPFKAKVGESKTISVKTILGKGPHNRLDLSVIWSKPEREGWNCWNMYNGRTADPSEYNGEYYNDINCQVFKLPTPELQCSMDIASINPEDNFEYAAEATLTFNKLTESDFGVYELKHHPAWDLNHPICNVTLQME